MQPHHLRCLRRGACPCSASEGARSKVGTSQLGELRYGGYPKMQHSLRTGGSHEASKVTKLRAWHKGHLMHAMASSPGGSPVLVSVFPCSWEASPFLFRAQIHQELRSSPRIQLGINIRAARKQIPMSRGRACLRTAAGRVEALVGGAFCGTAAAPPKLYITAE